MFLYQKDEISLPVLLAVKNGSGLVRSQEFIEQTLGAGACQGLHPEDPDRMVVTARGWTVRPNGAFSEVRDWQNNVVAHIHDQRDCPGGQLYMQLIS